MEGPEELPGIVVRFGRCAFAASVRDSCPPSCPGMSPAVRATRELYNRRRSIAQLGNLGDISSVKTPPFSTPYSRGFLDAHLPTFGPCIDRRDRSGTLAPAVCRRARGRAPARPRRNTGRRLSLGHIQARRQEIGACFADDAWRGRRGAYIARHGEGFHHISISVENLPEAIAHFESNGVRVLAANYENPLWKHCYLHPQDTCGALIQVFEENEKTLSEG